MEQTHPSQEAQADLREAEALASAFADNTSIVGAKRITNCLRTMAAELAILRSQQPVSRNAYAVLQQLVDFQHFYGKNALDPEGMPGNEVYRPMLQAIVVAATQALAARLSAPQAVGWLPMNSAPLDGTRVRLHVRHAGWWAAKKVSDIESERWEAIVEAEWIDFNGGGWTWNGMAGTPVGWQPLPAPPTQQGDSNG